MSRYAMAKAEDGSVTIVDSESNHCIIGVDVREVGGTVYHTPIFLDADLAYRVLDFLNGEDNV